MRAHPAHLVERAAERGRVAHDLLRLLLGDMALGEQHLDRIDHDHLRQLSGVKTAAAAKRAARGVQRFGELRGIERLGEQEIIEARWAPAARFDPLLEARAFLEADLAIGARDRDEGLRVEVRGTLVEGD